jgi:prephenate dehydratase
VRPRAVVKEEKAPNTLVLCSQEAAHTHGLAVLLDRIEGNYTISKYTIVGRLGAGAVRLQTRRSGSCKRQCTLLLSTIGRADLSDVVSAFAHLNLSIEHFSVRNHGDEPARYGKIMISPISHISFSLIVGRDSPAWYHTAARQAQLSKVRLMKA